MPPPLADILERLHVVALPMRVRFRGITVRELALIDGPAGWGEFGAFPEYDVAEAAQWQALAVGRSLAEAGVRPGDTVAVIVGKGHRQIPAVLGVLAAGATYVPIGTGQPPARRDRIPINATVPAVDADRVPEVLARFPGARTAKVKVAEPGQTLADDVARVEAVRALIPTVRVDANGGWTVDEAVRAAKALGPLEYLEQPCATVAELAALRARIATPVAADESIRKADDPLAVAKAGAADIAVLKVAPLGGISALLRIAEQIAMPVVVSSAIDSAVGIAAGLRAAAALPELSHACGLGTGSLLEHDVIDPAEIPALKDGYLPVRSIAPDPARLHALAASPPRRQWWIERLRACHEFLG